MFNPSIYHNLQEALLKNNVLDFLFWVCFLEIGSHYIHLTGLEFVMSTRPTSDAQPSLQGTRIKGEGVPPCLVCMIYAYFHACVYLHVYGAQRSDRALDCGEHTHVMQKSESNFWKSVLSFSFGFRNRAQVHQACVATTFTHGATLIACFKWLTVSHVIQNSSNQEWV